MKNATVNPLQTIVNAQAIRKAEAQFRLARLFTPYGFEPERVDFDRVSAFIGDIGKAFPQPTDSIKSSLDRIEAQLNEANAVIGAFAAQCVEPTLTADQLFTTAQANVINPGMARAA